MPTILIVDDEEIDRELASRCLLPLDDLRVMHAENGRQALDAIEAITPDVVLTDMRMPGMDGLELVEKMHDEHPLIPVLLMTSYGSEKIAVQALKAGAASYVPKDDLERDLLETVEQLLELLDARRSRSTILRCLDHLEMRFDLENDLRLISPLAGYVQESLQGLGFGTDSLRTQIGMALIEALANAIIHGNLEVSSDLRVDGNEPYYARIRQRQREAPYADRRVKCIVHESLDRVELAVLDEGPGFDHTALQDQASTDDPMRTQGRGLLLIRTFMDDVRYNEQGNLIVMSKVRWPGTPSAIE